ncbi:MAG: hypothetical protein HQK72_00605 [Desulfamplus sp.]|nr:hypothetical protein [Desulfamplus sp.]
MSSNKQSRGACEFCNKSMTRGGLTKHFSSCSQYKEKVEAANQKRGKEETIYHLQINDAWQKDFWLHLEMKGSAKLIDLDDYLRAIWLECCGHLSQFSIGDWIQEEEIPMKTPVAKVFQLGMDLLHTYDFGTSSETRVKVITQRKGKMLTKNPIYLMARNEIPKATCIDCENDASWLCLECLHEYEQPGFLCDDHRNKHPHDNYGEPIRLVNSPRMGMCAYDGPAEPPY